MEVGFALLATAAEMNPDGRFHILNGGLDGIRCHIPGLLTIPLYVAARLVVPPEEAGKQGQITVEMVTPDGMTLHQATEPFSLAPVVPTGVRRMNLGFVIVFNNIPLMTAGEYTFRISVDGVPVKSLPLTVVAAAAQPAPDPKQEEEGDAVSNEE